MIEDIAILDLLAREGEGGVVTRPDDDDDGGVVSARRGECVNVEGGEPVGGIVCAYAEDILVKSSETDRQTES